MTRLHIDARLEPAPDRDMTGNDRVHPTARQYLVKVGARTLGRVRKEYLPAALTALACGDVRMPGQWTWKYWHDELGDVLDTDTLEQMRDLVTCIASTKDLNP